MTRAHRAVLSLGANIGDAAATLRSARDHLAADADIEIVATSTLYTTAPIGGPEQPDFTNAVMVIATDLSPMGLLSVIHRIEDLHDRQRTQRWGPRTLDIDIVTFDDEVLDDQDLTVPHPRAYERAFVLIPWLEVDDAAVLPGHGKVIDLVKLIDDQAMTPAGVW
ncbi:MAG TPA: 2-amino-4-hydroxy-6-hydroxymethyldihydropteridine diphosphokinase [Actinobacteria bacterium]|nr:2-amino-4-hydroxy-6-hydroxymethyldihydropteridine diphosphokinase [Actinomycetota bacterium]HCK79211.1 2-amino-4-hydroxy-6-hydroxymethyldihydropteridine diphosphokinase [Actinomycetota bacterium]